MSKVVSERVSKCDIVFDFATIVVKFEQYHDVVVWLVHHEKAQGKCPTVEIYLLSGNDFASTTLLNTVLGGVVLLWIRLPNGL